MNLSSRVRDEIVHRITANEFGPGDPLREVELASFLGVSRTPLREALLRLSQEGLVEHVPNRGFRIPPLDVEIVSRIYPIIGALESLAVRSSDPSILKAQCDPMDRLIREMERGGRRPRQLYELDSEFHRLLTSACENPEVNWLIDRYKLRARPYDRAFERGMADVEGSSAAHRKIVELLRDGKLATAGRAVERHWIDGQRVVIRWLKERPSSKEKTS